MEGIIALVSFALWIGAWIFIVRRRKKMGLFAANLVGAVVGFVLFVVFAGVFLPSPTPEEVEGRKEAQRVRSEQEAVEKAKTDAERQVEVAKREEEQKAEKAKQDAEKAAAELRKNRSTMAAIICGNYVEQSLKAPKSADFPFGRAEGGIQTLGNQKYRIRSYVDAQNSYGAQLRNWYDCTIQYVSGSDADPRSWNLVNLKFASQ
ncbi:hypothetical protein [Pseudomonas japonica]|uniref:hypothetical protein n=1 Tax=Pseudomonas japonica TaxID=256466 RepID=UPI003A8C88EE